ncbi:MAG TPA: hypothetical protein PKH32_00385 [Verrucomicrobiota bacterium]|nr:hypothetical protein [Verrucomicrobiota bacterium]
MAFCLVECLEHIRLGQGSVHFALDEGGGDFTDAGVVLDEAGDEDADVVEREFADQGSEEENEFRVGFLAMLDGAFEEGTQGFGFLAERVPFRFELGDAGLEVVPPSLDFLEGGRRAGGRVLGLCHAVTLHQLERGFPLLFWDEWDEWDAWGLWARVVHRSIRR